VLEFFDSGHDVIFNGFCEGDIVRRENQLHVETVRRDWNKIQRNSF
jgi:hypothetical protein